MMEQTATLYPRWQIQIFTAAVALLTIFDAGSGFLRTLETGPERIGTTKKAADSGCLGCFQALALLVHLVHRCSLSFLFSFLGELVHLVHVNCLGCLIHVALHGHAVPHQILQLIGIIDVENLMVELVDKHHVLTLPKAFFPTLLMANTRTLSAALRVANPAFFPFILGRAGFCRREYGQRRHEKQHTTNRGYLFHLSSPDVQKRSSQNTLAK